MSDFWSWYIAILTIGNMVACLWLINWATKRRQGEAKEGDVTGHTWDGNLQEFNNPLPRWWLWLFYITLVFGFLYLILYPGLGNFAGTNKWTQADQYEAEMNKANATFGAKFATFAKQSIPDLAKNSQAIASGQRLFLAYCATCHGSSAEGVKGFPNLTDKDWLYGGTPEAIKASILDGRNGVMPSHAHLGDAAIENVTAYIEVLSGREADDTKANAGSQVFAQNCAVCHGADGKGGQAFGAPNLTDDTWLYGGSKGVIRESITKGRMGQMPAHRDFLGEDKAHVLAAYIYSLSAGK